MKKFDPNSFCIDDVFKYIDKKGKQFKDTLSKASKKKKKAHSDENIQTGTTAESKPQTYQSDITVEISM